MDTVQPRISQRMTPWRQPLGRPSTVAAEYNLKEGVQLLAKPASSCAAAGSFTSLLARVLLHKPKLVKR
jgi:hypothetical protein